MDQIKAVEATVVKAESWLKAHERLLIAALALTLGIWGFNAWVNVSANNAAAAASQANLARLAQDESVKVLQAQLSTQAQQFAQSQADTNARILALASAIAQRDAAAKQRVAEVTAPKTPTQAVIDLQSVYKLPDAPVVTENGATVSTADIQQFTVAKIEGDTAKANLVDTQTQLTKTTDTLNQAIALINKKDELITGLNSDIVAHDKASEKTISDLKAQARKSKWRIFWWGFGFGFASRQAIQIVTGH